MTRVSRGELRGSTRQRRFRLSWMVAFGVCLGMVEPVHAADFIQFYPAAYGETQAARPLRDYHIACTHTDPDGGYVTLLAKPGGRVVLGALSRGAPQDVQSLFDFAHNPEATRDWAYLWDRNGDGAVDYLAFYLGTEMVVTNGALPADFPRGAHPRLNVAQLEFVLRHTHMTFYHAADDNFDGRVDAMVFPLRDPELPLWVKGFVALRSTRFDDRVEQDWEFSDRIDQRLGAAPRNARGYRVGLDPTRGESGREILTHWTRVLGRFNGAVRACGLGARLRRR